MKVARGMAKNKPQKPQIPPKKRTATIITTGCKLFLLENNIGTRSEERRVGKECER